MKLRILALTLVLSLVAWAQTSPPSPSAPNSTPAPEAKGCCHHMADQKDGKGCCHHDAAEGKDAMACCGKDKCDMKAGKSCCEGKDMKSCMKQGKDGCCAEGKGCCGGSADKTAAGCCGGNKCEHHEHAAS